MWNVRLGLVILSSLLGGSLTEKGFEYVMEVEIGSKAGKYLGTAHCRQQGQRFEGRMYHFSQLITKTN